MIPWWVGMLLGTVLVTTSNSLSRMWSGTVAHLATVATIGAVATVFYWYGFHHAPKFINCWFIGSAMKYTLAVAIGLLFFDKSMSGDTAAGIVCVFIGAYLLIR